MPQLQITSIQTSLPLKFQVHEAIGFLICFIAMLGIYYMNAWDAKSLPFMSTRLWTAGGKAYPTSEVFLGGVLDKTAFAKYGIPRLSGTFAYAMFMANAAVRCPLFLSVRLFPLDPLAFIYTCANQNHVD